MAALPCVHGGYPWYSCPRCNPTPQPDSSEIEEHDRISKLLRRRNNHEIDQSDLIAAIQSLIREARREEAQKQLDELPDAVFVPDEADALTNAGGKGLAIYRYKIQTKLIDRIKELTDTNSGDKSC